MPSHSRFALLIVLTALQGAHAATQDAAAIAEVASGKRTEAKAAWWGFDPADSTAALQSAIRSGARKVIVENLGAPWIVDKIRLASNQEIVFEPGVVVQAKRGAFHEKTDSLFTAEGCSNVTLTGPGATLKMWKEDYTGPDYSKAEWRNTIAIRSCANVRITGLTLADSGGDGIYLGASHRGDTNRHVEIRDVTFRNHHRQGISVISAEDLLIENCALLDTAGTAPQSGIDFEPNSPEDRLVRCVMRHCRSENNRGIGYQFYLGQLKASTLPLSIRIEHCTSKGCQQGVNFATGNTETDAVGGLVEFVDCRFEDALREGVEIRRKPARGCQVVFERCTIVNPAAKEPTLSPIGFGSIPGNSEDIGGAKFVDCTIEDPIDRRPVSFVDPVGELRLLDVTGQLRVLRNGTSTTVNLTPELLSAWFPTPPVRKFPKVKVDPASLRLVSPEAHAENWPIHARVRESGTWLAAAKSGTEVSLALRIQALGKQSVHDVPVQVTSPTGKQVAAKLSGTPDERQVTFRAGEAGIYRISCQPGSLTAELTRSSVPACLFPEVSPLHLVSTTGELRFWVPAGVKSFGVKLAGGGGTERVKAALIDPAGKLIEEQDNIDRAAQFAVDLPAASAGAAWTIKLARPTQGVMEDFTVQLQGIPGLIAQDAHALLRSSE